MKPPSKRPRKHLLGLLFGGVSLSLALVVAEFGLRLVAPQPISWLSIYAPHDVLPYRLAPGISQRVDTGETDWWVHVDTAGYRAADAKRERDESEDHHGAYIGCGCYLGRCLQPFHKVSGKRHNEQAKCHIE